MSYEVKYNEALEKVKGTLFYRENRNSLTRKLDADKVIEWLEDQACQGWIEDVEVEKFVDKFKKDFEI